MNGPNFGFQHKDFQEGNLKKTLVAALLGFITLFGTMASATAKEDSVERLQNAGDVLKEIMDAPDKGIPEEVLDDAKCIVVVPHLIKAGFIFGGKHGRGVASCRTATGWSAPAFISVGGGSWGLQIGAEGVDLVMLVMNDKGCSTCCPASSSSAVKDRPRPDRWGAMLPPAPTGN